MAEERSKGRNSGWIFPVVWCLLAWCLPQQVAAPQVLTMHQQFDRQQQQLQRRRQLQQQREHDLQPQEQEPQLQQQQREYQHLDQFRQQQQHQRQQQEVWLQEQRQEQQQQQQQQHEHRPKLEPWLDQEQEQQQAIHHQQQEEHQELKQLKQSDEQQNQQQQQKQQQQQNEQQENQEQHNEQEEQLQFHRQSDYEEHQQQQPPPSPGEGEEGQEEERGGGVVYVTSRLAAHVGKLTEVKVVIPEDLRHLLDFQNLPPWLLYEEGEGTLRGVPTSQYLGATSFTFSSPCLTPQHPFCQRVQHHVDVVVHSASQSAQETSGTSSSGVSFSGSGMQELPSTSVDAGRDVLLTERLSASSSQRWACSDSVGNGLDLPRRNCEKVAPDESSMKVLSRHNNKDGLDTSEGQYTVDSSTKVLSRLINEDNLQTSEVQYKVDPLLSVKHSENKQCNSQHMASLVLCWTPDKVTSSQRVLTIQRTADFLSIPADTLAWLNSPGDRLLFSDDGYQMEAGGASDHSNCSEEVHSELFWPLSCSASRHLQEFSKILQHNVQVGRIEREVGVVVVGWYLASRGGQVSHRRRRRRVGLRTPVATPGVYTSSATVMSSLATSQSGFDLTSLDTVRSSGEPGFEPTFVLSRTVVTDSFNTAWIMSQATAIVSSPVLDGMMSTPTHELSTPSILLPSEAETSRVVPPVLEKPTPTLDLTSDTIFSGDLLSSSAIKMVADTPEIRSSSTDGLIPQIQTAFVESERLTDVDTMSERTQPLWSSWLHSSMREGQSSSFLESLDGTVITERTLPFLPVKTDHYQDAHFTATADLDTFTPPLKHVPSQLLSPSLQPVSQSDRGISTTTHIDTSAGEFGQKATMFVNMTAAVDGSYPSSHDQQGSAVISSVFWPSPLSESYVSVLKSSVLRSSSIQTSLLDDQFGKSIISTSPAFQSDKPSPVVTLEQGLISKTPDLFGEKISFWHSDHESVLVSTHTDILALPNMTQTLQASPVSQAIDTSVTSNKTASLASEVIYTVDGAPQEETGTIISGQPVTKTKTTPLTSTSRTTTTPPTFTSRKSTSLTRPWSSTTSRTTAFRKWRTHTTLPPTTSLTMIAEKTTTWKWTTTTTTAPSWANTTFRTLTTTSSRWWRKKTTEAPKTRPTTPWWWGTGEGTTRRKLPPKPATKTPVRIDPPNNPPFLVKSVSYMTVKLGCYFEKKIPDNMFYDVEDGSTSFLTLTLTLPYDRPLPANFWVQLDSSRQVLMGLPLVADLDMDYNSVVIVATDSQGLGARNPISLYVNTSAFIRFTHRFILKFGVEFGQFMRRRDNMISVMKKIGSYFGDDSARHVTVVDVGMGSFILSWTNSSLSGSSCMNDTIHYLLRRMVRKNGSVRSAFKRHLGKKLRLMHIRYQLEGPCLYHPPSPTIETTTDMETTITSVTEEPLKGSSSDLITEVILPVLIALLLLLLIIIVVLLVYRCRQHRATLENPNKEVCPVDLRPVIMQNELPNLEAYRARPKKPRNVPYEPERQTGSFPRNRPHTFDHYRLSGSLSRNRPNSYTFDDEMAESRPVTVIFNNFDSFPRQSRPPSYWNELNEETPPNISVPPPYFSTTSV